MTTIHLICGFMGFGKTTLAKKLAEETGAVRLTPDEIMAERYGRNLPEPEFRQKWKEIDADIWRWTAEYVRKGRDVILDYGFWTRESRREACEKAEKTGASVVFHQLVCDMETARQRVLKRTKENPRELFIDGNCFDLFAAQYTPVQKGENDNVIYHEK
jgi:predicted kinase